MEAAKKRKLEVSQSQKTAAYSLTNFDLSSFPPVDISVLSQSYEAVVPQTKTNDVINIYIAPSPSHWIALDQCFLYLSLAIKKNTYTFDPAAATGVTNQTAFGNYLLGTFFEEIDIKLNGVSITTGGNLSHYSAMFHKLLYNSTETLERRGHLEGFYLNTDAKIVNEANGSYKMLLGLGKKDHMELYGRLPHSLFESVRYIPPNVSIEIRLRLAPNNFCLNSPKLGTGVTFKDSLEIKGCYFDIFRVIAHSRVDLMYETALKSKKTLGFPLVDYQTTSFVIPSGNVTYTSEVLLNRLPTYAAFALVDSRAYFGDHTRCPFEFQPYNLNGYKFSLNGDDLLFNNARMSVSNNEYIRHYKQLLTTKNERGELTCNFDVEQYTKWGYHVIKVWDSLDGKRNRTPTLQDGQIRLSLHFKEATDMNLTCIFYYELPKRIEMEGNNIFVKTDFLEDKQ